MPKKKTTLDLIREAGPILMLAAVQHAESHGDKRALAELRTALYHLTRAQLWIFAPDAMEDAEAGALGRMREKLADRSSPPPPINGMPPLKTPLK